MTAPLLHPNVPFNDKTVLKENYPQHGQNKFEATSLLLLAKALYSQPSTGYSPSTEVTRGEQQRRHTSSRHHLRNARVKRANANVECKMSASVRSVLTLLLSSDTSTNGENVSSTTASRWQSEANLALPLNRFTLV